MDNARKDESVVDDLVKLRKVPRVPLANAHSAGIEILVNLIQKAYRLDNHIVLAIHIKLNLGAGVRVTKAELGALCESPASALTYL